MDNGRDFTIGDRIRYFRERRGLSQKALGEMVGRSENWCYKVEHGQLPVDRVPVLIQLAKVLRVKDLSDLTGGFLSGAADGPETEHDAVPTIRRTLSLPTSLLPSGVGDVRWEDFADGVADAWQVYETQTQGRYADVGGRLPNLLREGHAVLRDARDEAAEQDAARSLISLYGLHQIWLRRVGEPVQARIAADRGMALADRVGDPALLAAAAWNLSCVLTSAGEVEDSVELARETIASCTPGQDAAQEYVSAYGALHLQAAVAAVRANMGPVAWDLFRGAQAAAGRIGEDRNDWHTCFGPTNVEMHSVHLAAEEGDISEALRLADTVSVTDTMPLERRTRYLIEVMNCNRIQRDDYATVFMLRQLKEQSPEEIVFSPLVREAVTDLMKREKPTFREDLRTVARHVGIAA